MAPANCLDRISGSILLQRALPSIHALERKMILSIMIAIPTARVSRIGYIKKPPLLKKSMIAQNVSITPPHSLFIILCLCVYPVTPEGEDQNPEQYDGHL